MRGRRRIFVLLLSLLVLLLGLSCLPASYHNFSVGQSSLPPYCPPNRYDSNFTSFMVTSGGQSIDVLRNPGVTFTALTDQGYDVSFVLLTANASSTNNTLFGTTWYSGNQNGSPSGVCVGQSGTPVGPSKSVPVNFHVSLNFTYNPSQGSQSVLFQSYDNGTYGNLLYNVNWVDQTSLNLICSAEIGKVICDASVNGIYSPSDGPLGTPGGVVNLTSGSSLLGQCNLLGSGDTSGCSISFTPDFGLISVTGSYSGDSLHAASSNSTTVNCCPVPTHSTTTTKTTHSTTRSTSMNSTTQSTETISNTTSFETTNSTQPSGAPPTTQSTPPGGLTYTESAAALVVSAVVIAGILGVAIRKAW